MMVARDRIELSQVSPAPSVPALASLEALLVSESRDLKSVAEVPMPTRLRVTRAEGGRNRRRCGRSVFVDPRVVDQTAAAPRDGTTESQLTRRLF
jgi:hypothetical protein